MDCAWMTGNPEAMSSSVGLVPTNALVLTDQANFREVGYTEAITELFVWASELSRPDHAQREKLSIDMLE
jgi:hypothetical protein